MHPPRSPRKAVASQTVTAVPIAAAMVANVLLAFGPWFVRLADVGPVAAGFWRLLLAVPIILAAALASGWRPGGMPRRWWFAVAAGGFCFALDLGSWHLGILRTTLANATLFGNSATLMFPIYGFLVARAWPTGRQALALLLAAIGGGLLLGRSYQLDPRHLAGDLLCVTAGILYTGYFIFLARVRTTTAPLPALALSSLASVLPLLFLSLALGERLWPHHWGPLLGLALASQVLGQGCMIYALGTLPPLVVGLALLIQPVVAGAIGWFAYGERLGVPDLIGALLVAAALVLVGRSRPTQVELAVTTGDDRI